MESEPVTEASNSITADIDLADSEGIVALLQQCDSQIFTGWKLYQSLYSPDVTATIDKVANIAGEILKNEQGGIILSGCGTSGRLAFITARTYNHYLNNLGCGHNKFHYTIAGRDRALLLSTEAIEDSWKHGMEDLVEVTGNLTQVLFIGITCGLSAPYVAGQLDYCMQHLDKYTPVLLGFNLVEQSRKIPINNWNGKTFYDVAMAMKTLSDNCFIINPVVGPEPITGSSRMKSGSATKIILETLFMTSLNRFLQPVTSLSSPINNLLLSYELTYRYTYLQSPNIAKLLEAAGKSLCSGGRVCYVGQKEQGIMSVIDASECLLTYGSKFDDVRGFLQGGWLTMNNKEGDISIGQGSEYRLDWDYFEDAVIPQLTEKDVVIFVGDITGTENLLQKVQERHCPVGVVNITDINQSSYCYPEKSITVIVKLPFDAIRTLLSSYVPSSVLSMFLRTLTEMSTKWILNAISTGAHIMKGKVLGNRMIDLYVSNTKLYHRTIGIIQELTGVEKDVAERHLLLSIYGNDLAPPTTGNDIIHHVAAATSQDMVVPSAILMIKKKCSLLEARELLKSTPILRKALT